MLFFKSWNKNWETGVSWIISLYVSNISFWLPSVTVLQCFKQVHVLTYTKYDKNIRDTFPGTKHFMKVLKYQHIWKYMEREQVYTIQALFWRLVNKVLMPQDVVLHHNLHASFQNICTCFLNIEESRQMFSGTKMLIKVCCLEYLLPEIIKWFTLKSWSPCVSECLFAKYWICILRLL